MSSTRKINIGAQTGLSAGFGGRRAGAGESASASVSVPDSVDGFWLAASAWTGAFIESCKVHKSQTARIGMSDFRVLESEKVALRLAVLLEHCSMDYLLWTPDAVRVRSRVGHFR